MRQHLKSLYFVALLAALFCVALPNPSAFAQSCEIRLTRSSVKWTESVNQESGQQILPSARFAYQQTNGKAKVPMFLEAPVVTSLVIDIFSEIELRGIKSLAEALYTVTDTPLDDIPRLVSSAFRGPHSSITASRESRKIAELAVAQLVAKRLPRLTLEEITEELKIHLQAFEGLLIGIKSGRANWADYRSHLQYVMSTPTGRLLLISPLRPAGFELLKLEGKNSLSTTTHMTSQVVTERKVQRARQQLHSQFRAEWNNGLASWKKVAGSLKSTSYLKGNVRDRENPYFWLARFLESSPVAVAHVLKNNPKYQEHLCWILTELDGQIFRADWSAGFESIWSKISIPLYVVGIAVIPTLMSGAPLVIIYGGLVVLQAAGLVSVSNTFMEQQTEKQNRGFYTAALSSGVGGKVTIEAIEEQSDEIKKASQKIGTSVALNVASAGMAKSLSLITFRRVQKMNRSVLAETLWRGSQRVSRYSRGRHLDSRLNDKLESILPFNDFFVSRKALSSRSISYEETKRLWVHDVIKKLPQSQINSLLFKSHDFGFGRTLLLTEMGTSLAQELHEISTEDFFKEVNPIENFMNFKMNP